MAVPIILTSLIVTLIVFLLSALPLHLAVKFLGGKTNIFKTAIFSFIAGIVVAVIEYRFRFAGIIAFILMIWIYREAFKLKWWKAILAWLLQFVFVAILYFLAALLLGLSFGLASIF